MRYVVIWVILMLLLVSVLLLGPIAMICKAETLQGRVIQNSAKYLQLRERTNHNDAPEIDRMLAYLGLPKGLSWCAAFVIWNHHEVGYNLPRQGRCASLWSVCRANELRYKTFEADEVMIGAERLHPGDIPIWAHGRISKTGDFNGHTGLVLKQLTSRKFASREGNTVSSNIGNQREGGGVFDRQRVIDFSSPFRVLGFIRVRS